MDHAGAEDFEPIAPLTHFDGAAAERTLDINLGAGFREREMGRAEAGFDGFAEIGGEEFLKHPFQVRHGQVFINRQPFDLMEHRRVCLVVIGAVNATRTNDADRRALLFHFADLNRRRVRAQDVGRAVVALGAVHIERVHFGAGRMVTGDVERVEVVPIGFNLRPFGGGETHVGEDGGTFLPDLRHGVDGAHTTIPRGQCHVQPFSLQARVQCRIAQRHFLGNQGGVNLVLQRIQRGTGCLAFLGRHFTKGTHLQADLALFADRLNPQVLERGLITSAAYQIEVFGFEIVHESSPFCGRRFKVLSCYPAQPRTARSMAARVNAPLGVRRYTKAMNMTTAITVPLPTLFEATRAISAVPLDDVLAVPIGFLNDLNEAITRRDILGVYSVWVTQLVGADRCSIALADDAGGLIVTAANGGRGIEPGTRHDIATTVWGAVFEKRQTLFVPDAGMLDLPDAVTVRALGFISAILVPISKGTQRYGAVAASYADHLDNPGPPMAMLQAMAQCLGTQLMVVDQLEKLAGQIQEDALTGAPNRHYLNDHLGRVWSAWTRTKTPFSFLTLDIDKFKEINDTYGHDIGDAVLCELVNRLGTRNRTGDALVRMGGEEFGMILRGANLDDAARVSQRFRNALKAAPITVGPLELSVTASFGIAQVDESDLDVKSMMKRADRAMYHAKYLGRDQIVASRSSGMIAI